MSLLFGRRRQDDAGEVRSLEMPPGYMAALAANFADAGVSTAESSLQSVAFRSGVDLIASIVSETPLDVFSGQGSKRAERKTPRSILDPGGDGRGLEDWVYRLVTSWLLRGNTFGLETEWDPRTGRAVAADLAHPDDVHVTIVDGAPQWSIKGKVVEDPSVFRHWRVNPMAGRLLGLSPIELHATTLGISLASGRFGQQWFKDGSHPTGLLVSAHKLSEEEADKAKKRWMATTRGSREPVTLGMGWDYKALQVSPAESQFLETQGFTEAQAARILGPGVAEILGYDSGGSMTYANVADRSVHLLQFAVNRWFRRTERVLFDFLPAPQWVRFNRDAFLQSTTLQRYQAHGLALAGRWKTVNEVREHEDMAPVAWGDEPNGPAAAPGASNGQEPAGGGTGGNPSGA